MSLFWEGNSDNPCRIFLEFVEPFLSPSSFHTPWKWHFLFMSTHGNGNNHQTTTNFPPSHLAPSRWKKLSSLSSPWSFVHPFFIVGLIPLRTAHWLWCSSFWWIWMCSRLERKVTCWSTLTLELVFLSSILWFLSSPQNKRLHLEWLYLKWRAKGSCCVVCLPVNNTVLEQHLYFALLEFHNHVIHFF